MENRVKIIIERGDGNFMTLWLTDNFPISLNFSVAEIRDITKRSGNYSKTISIPSTPENDNVFDDLWDIRSSLYNFDLTKKYKCKLYKNDVEQFSGYIVLNNIQKNPNSNHYTDAVDMVYNVTIYSQTVDFFTSITDKYLDDIDFQLPHHHLYMSTILSYSANTYLNTFKYFNFKNASANNYSIADFWPAIFTKCYVDRIVNDAGYHYDNTQSSFMASDPFTKLITPYAGSINIKDPNMWDTEKFYVGEPAAASTTYYLSQSQVVQQFNATTTLYHTFDFSDHTTYPFFENDYNQPVGSVYEVTALNGIQYMYANLKCVLRYSASTDCWWSQQNGYTVNAAENYVRNRSRVLKVKAYKNGAYLSQGIVTVDALPCLTSYDKTTPDMVGGTIYETPINTTLNFSLGSLAIGDQIQLKFEFQPFTTIKYYTLNGVNPNLTPFAGGTLQFTNPTYGGTVVYPDFQIEMQNSHMWNVPENTATRSAGDIIDINNYLPKNVKQTDYLTNVMKMFNVYIDEDKNYHNRLVFKTRDDYYSTNVYKDWSGKIDRNKNIELKYLSELTAKKTILTYKNGSDEYSIKYQQYMNEIYGQKNIIYNSDILTGEEKKEFIFTTAPLVYNDSLIVSGLDGCNPTTDLYLLYDGGIRDGLWRYKDENNVLHQMNQYNYCGHFDSPTPAPSFDLNFGDCKAYFYNNVYYTDNNLFNLYHYNTYKNISEGKMMTAYFWLNEDDIAGLKLSDKIVVDHITYIINSITDYNPFSNDSTKVELVLFDNIYTKAPARKKPIRLSAHTINDIGFIQGNNSSNRQSNITTNVNILGLENRVSASDVIVLGNNNVIGYPNTTVIGNQWNTTGDTSNSVLIGEYKGQDVTPDSIILSAPNIILDGTIQLDGLLDHNTLTNLQGGTTNEYYHLTSNQYHVVQNPLWISGSTGSYSIKTNNGSGNDATGNYALSEGYKTNAIGVASHAEGNTTAATGAYSHSEGRNTQATNSQAHAEGFTSLATGDSSHAEGYQTRATGAYSHSQNRDTRATGDYTYAGGYNSQATGSTSFVHSYNSVCSGARSAVIGGENIYGYADDTVYVPNLYVTGNTNFNSDVIYNDTFWDDMRIVPSGFDFAGTGDPSLVDLTIGTFVYKAYEFAINDAAYFSIQLPHTYKQNSQIYCHIHWTPRNYGVAQSGNTVAWKMEYTWANINSVFSGSTIIDMTDYCSGIDNKHQMTADIILPNTDKNISSMMLCKIYRDTGDTWSETVTGRLPILLEVDFHYEIDRPGSRERSTK